MCYEAVGCAGDAAFSNVCSMHTLNYSKTYSICFTWHIVCIHEPQPCIKTNNWQRNSCNHKPIVFNKITCLQRCTPSFTIRLWTSTISVSYSVMNLNVNADLCVKSRFNSFFDMAFGVFQCSFGELYSFLQLNAMNSISESSEKDKETSRFWFYWLNFPSNGSFRSIHSNLLELNWLKYLKIGLIYYSLRL